VDEARIAPLRAVDTTTLTVPAIPPSTGRLRLLAAGVATPGGNGSCVGTPLWLDSAPQTPPTTRPFVAVVPPGLGYARAAELLRGLAGAGVPIEAVLVASDEGVLIANRIDSRVPVIDQVDVSGVAACPLVAVEVRAPGQPLTLLTDPVALAAAFALGDAEIAYLPQPRFSPTRQAGLPPARGALGRGGRGACPAAGRLRVAARLARRCDRRLRRRQRRG
jgi:predicted aconitase with swiveling domain